MNLYFILVQTLANYFKCGSYIIPHIQSEGALTPHKNARQFNHAQTLPIVSIATVFVLN